MPRRHELSEALRTKVVEMHEARKGYKTISKTLDVHVSTVRQIVSKWKQFGTVASLPRSGRPVKMTPRAQRTIINEVKKNPEVSSKDLQKSLDPANISTSTIRKALNKNGIYGRRAKGRMENVPGNAALQFVKRHLDGSQLYWHSFLLTDETKAALLGGTSCLDTPGSSTSPPPSPEDPDNPDESADARAIGDGGPE